jgi:hypothetical protein
VRRACCDAICLIWAEISVTQATSTAEMCGGCRAGKLATDHSDAVKERSHIRRCANGPFFFPSFVAADTWAEEASGQRHGSSANVLEVGITYLGTLTRPMRGLSRLKLSMARRRGRATTSVSILFAMRTINLDGGRACRIHGVLQAQVV